MKVRTTATITLLLLCAACKDEVPVEAQDDARRTAEGEVLGGSISDEMIPLDRLRSQSPPLNEEGASGSGADGAGTPSSGGSTPAATARPSSQAGEDAD